MAISVLLVDSNTSLLSDLRNLLAIHRSFLVAAEVETTEEAIDYIQFNPVDVVFVNTQPADARRTSDGNCLAITLAQSHPHIQVVIYSDKRENAYGACRNQAAGFLQFPFDPLEFQLLANRLGYIYDLQQAKRESRSIMIKTQDGYRLIRLNDILFIERSARKNQVVTTDGQTFSLQGYSMGQLEEMLRNSGFYRCYQSFIVNLSKVSVVRIDNRMKTYFVRFKDYDGEIPLSRNKYSEFVNLLKARYVWINL